MFGLFKSDPVKKLQKERKKLLEKAYKLSHTDRSASDQMMAKVDEIDKKIEELKG
ncbi:Lacal_2735 family protein [Marinigracilibium pacificum]|uniref:Lacal_2735 family protein n=1 Tax=Marinigracilibium pacificum TaxID=2729599 RepID=A0A848J3I6_9BACT|nr:Lacal_2735 family protein [Marinigracilibium pacificum]NMM49054.1 Lacal_2735 family protein [Marinigracilibium pacificum]